MPKLNQVLAIEKEAKNSHVAALTALHRTCGDPKFFNGLEKTYRAKDEMGEAFPPESVRVQARTDEVLRLAQAVESDLINIVSMKDSANMQAKADVVVDGNVLLKDVPATHLLWLDKRLVDWHTFITKLPELDLAENWAEETGNPGLYRSPVRQTHRTSKEPYPVVLIEPGPHTEGKAEIIHRDVVVGYWDTTKFSAAIPPVKKRELLDRLTKLQRAIRFAREKANLVEIDPTEYGTAVMNYLLG